MGDVAGERLKTLEKRLGILDRVDDALEQLRRFAYDARRGLVHPGDDTYEARRHAFDMRDAIGDYEENLIEGD